ncbi:mevalonate kinase [Georgenia sunbinii]|uniref:mevalonate kinase n=1 Tax=Georgenia sunbinii TaxID=3117728 RepID=UPI002F26A3E4
MPSPRFALPRAAAGSAHAKGILIGEHSAVYGHPAIALPLTPLRTVAEVRPAAGPLLLSTDGRSLPVDLLPERFVSVGVAATAALDFFGLPARDLEITVHSDIPPRAGLGASAAAANAIIEAVRAYAGMPLDEDTRFALVQTAERVAHGNPSGIDAYATRADGPFLFTDGRRTPLAVGAPAWLVVADTGVRASTGEAVAGVRRAIDADPARGEELLAGLGDLTRGVVRDLELGRLAAVGTALTSAQESLSALDVGHPAVDLLVGAATDAGAVGAKLTGAGRGGCVIALATGAAQAQAVLGAMTAAGAVAGWVVTVDPA